MKKFFSVALSILLLLFALTACKTEGSSLNNNSSDKISIVASLFPHYDFAKQIAKEFADVQLLLPPGSESHGFEPSPSDIIKIYESDIFLYTGEAMEHWAHKLIDGIPNDSSLVVVDLSSGIQLLSASGKEHSASEDIGLDPHIWTSPLNAIKISESIFNSLSKSFPEKTTYFAQNLKVLVASLESLDAGFREVMKDTNQKTIYFGSRFALRYLCEEYGINAQSAYDNCSEETEPSVQDMLNIIEAMRAAKAEFVYYQELEDLKISGTINEETGAQMLLFHSAHNVTSNEMAQGASYVSLMQQNIINLGKGVA